MVKDKLIYQFVTYLVKSVSMSKGVVFKMVYPSLYEI